MVGRINITSRMWLITVLNRDLLLKNIQESLSVSHISIPYGQESSLGNFFSEQESLLVQKKIKIFP